MKTPQRYWNVYTVESRREIHSETNRKIDWVRILEASILCGLLMAFSLLAVFKF